MAVRTALLFSFIAGAIFGAALLWLIEDSPKPSETVTPGGGSVVEAAGPVAMGSDPGCSETCSEDLERALFELARERERVARLTAEPESEPATPESEPAAPRKPVLDYGGRARDRKTGFDPELLRESGFSSDDIEWIRERWEQAEIEKRYLADLEARDEDPPRAGALSDVERELREDLGDTGYDAMLYASHQSNRVAFERVRDGSIADRAGLRDGTVLWSYDGQRVFNSKELAALSTSGKRGEPVEIVIITDDGFKKLFVERNPLGADLVSAKQQPSPD